VCLAELESQMPGGYCTKVGCDIPGLECDGATDVCARAGGSAGAACLRGCRVGVEAEADRLGPSGHGADCRPGYRCEWNEVDGSGVVNGACLAGNYNEVSVNNIGAECGTTESREKADARCYSPFGIGVCAMPERRDRVPSLRGLCTVRHCAAPGIRAADVCGPDAQCIGTGAQNHCVPSCSSADECAPGYACSAVSTRATAPHGCVPDCTGDAECTADRYCDIWGGATSGRCALR